MPQIKYSIINDGKVVPPAFYQMVKAGGILFQATTFDEISLPDFESTLYPRNN